MNRRIKKKFKRRFGIRHYKKYREYFPVMFDYQKELFKLVKDYGLRIAPIPISPQFDLDKIKEPGLYSYTPYTDFIGNIEKQELIPSDFVVKLINKFGIKVDGSVCLLDHPKMYTAENIFGDVANKTISEEEFKEAVVNISDKSTLVD